MIDGRYLAGFIDGEGCFNVTKCRTTIYVRLLIVNTNIDILKEIQQKYGGDINSRKNGKSNWKVFNTYRATGRAFRRILDDVYPYLIIKKAVATRSIQLMATKYRKRRLELKEVIQRLNKRGI